MLYPDFDVNNAIDAYKKMKVPTAHQDKLSYGEVQEQLTLINALLKTGHIALPCGNNFKFATLFSTEINAKVENNINHERVILVNSRTLSFATDLAQLLIEPAIKKDDGKRLLIVSKFDSLKKTAGSDPVLRSRFLR